MSVLLECPEAMNATELQIWNNAAFDNGESAAIRNSWLPLKPIFLGPSDSLDSVSSKENQSPVFVKSPVLMKSPRPITPLDVNSVIVNSKMETTDRVSKHCLLEKWVLRSGIEEEVRDEKKIDVEIEEIEKEISRLSEKLEVLRLEKAKKTLKMVEKRGRVVPAKFMEQKQSAKKTEEVKKSEEISALSVRTKMQRRGVSLGPTEIVALRRRVSLGPSEIISGANSRQLGKQEITPVQPIQSTRKLCSWKLQEIDEEKVTKERRKSLSPSPKSRKAIAKNQALRQAATTVASKKAVKKEEGVLASIQPKILFKDGEKSVLAKKPLKLGRVVASRYNQITVQSNLNSALRKRSLPENEKDESKRWDKKRSLSVGKSRGNLVELGLNQGTEVKVKKRWEIPSELVVVRRNLEAENCLPSVAVLQDNLPRIRTFRCINESPRDSGPAKRVAELVGRKSYFSSDAELEPSVCQALNFAEDVADK